MRTVVDWTFQELAWLEELIDSESAIADLQPEEVDRLLETVLPRLTQRLLASIGDSVMLHDITDDVAQALCDDSVVPLAYPEEIGPELRVDLTPDGEAPELSTAWTFEFGLDAAGARRYALLLLIAANRIDSGPEHPGSPSENQT